MMAWLRRKRDGLTSLAILLGLVSGLLVVVMLPVLAQADKYRAELRKDRRILQELRAIEAVQLELAEVRERYAEGEFDELVYQAGKPADVGLDIQRNLSGWLSGTQVQRITPVEGRAKDGYVEVGVQVQFTASLPALTQVFTQIESSSPRLAVTALRLSPVRQRPTRNRPVPEQLLSVQMTVQAVLPVMVEK